MHAIVVYESHWGNTAAIARAIAEGIGPEARALSTAEATGEALSDIDLVVAGAPLLSFALPTDGMLKSIAANAAKDPAPPDLSRPSMRSWLDALPKGAFLKAPSWLAALLAAVAAGALYVTARVEERENLLNFGAQYVDYVRETRMFIPLVF